MADAIEKAVDGSTLQDTSGNPVTKQVDTSHFPKDMIAETDASAYKQAGDDFMILDREKFLDRYPELRRSAEMYKEVENRIHIGDKTEFVRNAVKEKMAEEIADAKYPIVDHEKSQQIANAYAEAKTPEQREKAIQAYPLLEGAFKFSDAMQEITGHSQEATKDIIASGKIPQFDASLQRSLDYKASLDAQAHQQEQGPSR